MTHRKFRHNRHVTGDLHPSVYKAAVGFAFWYALAAWLLFANAGYQKFVLIMVSFVMLATVGVPAVAFFTGRRFRRAFIEKDRPAGSLREWLAADFQTWQARLPAGEAAVQILLPLAAAAIGITLLGFAMVVSTA